MITDPIMKCQDYGLWSRAARGFCYSTLTSRGDDQGAVFRAWSSAPAKNSMQGVRLSLTLPGAP